MPGEQATFKELTLGQVLLMGHALTNGTIGRPLPGRTTISCSPAHSAWSPGHDEVRVARSVEEALRLADVGPMVTVAGAAQRVDAATMDAADEQVLSRIPLSPDGDVHYPAYDEREWVETTREAFPGYERVRLVRS